MVNVSTVTDEGTNLLHHAANSLSPWPQRIEKLKELGLWIFTAEAGGTPYYETDWNCGAAVVMGSEGQGVRKEILDSADAELIIPMNPHCESLNAAVAATIVMWQMKQ